MRAPGKVALHCGVLLAVLSSPPDGAGAAAVGPSVRLRSIGGDRASGVARLVVVEAGSLVHTALMLPDDGKGGIDGAGDAAAQGARVLGNIDRALDAARTSLDQLVRLHVYVADASVTPRIERLLAERFGGRDVRPAVTFVESAMVRDGVLVAMDAVAATAWTPAPGTSTRIVVDTLPRRTATASHAAIQPAGPFVIVSGRAAPGAFDTAIRETLAQLRADLERVGLTFDQVVQVKSFLGDMTQARRLEELVAAGFAGASAPPQVITGGRLEAPAEIELVATAPRRRDTPADGVEHLEPTLGRYSKVARANTGQPVFISGLYGASANPAAQVDEMFAELGRTLAAAGSDIRHLVKATYYVADTAADQRINEIRPLIYDAAHPPAASKLVVPGTGRAGKGSTFDMIAVTTAR